MALYNLRVNSQIQLDEEKHRDVITCLKDLNSKHKLGQFLSNLIKIASDKPEILTEYGNEYLTKGEAIKFIEDTGMTQMREKFFNAVQKDISLMRDKVDKMYEMIFEMYVSNKFGKQIGIEDKLKNNLMAQFLIEKQIKDIQDILGIQDLSLFESDKINNIENLSDNVLKYIIEKYSGIIEEVKRVEVRETVKIKEVTEEVEVNEDEIVDFGETVTENENKSEYVDFGEADLAALSTFFGD